MSSVDELIEDGRLLEAVDALAARNRANANAADEIALIDLRRRAASVAAGISRLPWPPPYDDPFPQVSGMVPEVGATGLDGATLGGAVLHHGALLVRGLLADDQVASARRAIDLSQERAASLDRPADDRWYRPFPGLSGDDRILRKMVSGHGGTWLADSPAATALVLDQLADTGAIDAITDYFGCRPHFSLQKSTLRRSPPVFNFAGWHQDGSFLGPDARAMNVWMALTPCGGDRPTPGLELIPARMSEILPPDNGPNSAWIADDHVHAVAPAAPVTPPFEPGDALMFDERFLHRSHLTEQMTDSRDAIECWFFAPGHEAEKYIPLLA